MNIGYSVGNGEVMSYYGLSLDKIITSQLPSESKKIINQIYYQWLPQKV